MKTSMMKGLKQKGFSRKTEALKMTGGGETHSELFPGAGSPPPEVT